MNKLAFAHYFCPCSNGKGFLEATIGADLHFYRPEQKFVWYIFYCTEIFIMIQFNDLFLSYLSLHVT